MPADQVLTAAPAAPLVFAVLDGRSSHGYEIATRVRELSGGQLDWPDGMLYPLLRRLHRLGYVHPEWRTPPDGHRRRYYTVADDRGRPGEDLAWAAVRS